MAKNAFLINPYSGVPEKGLGRKSKSYRPKAFFFYSLPQKDYLGHYRELSLTILE